MYLRASLTAFVADEIPYNTRTLQRDSPYWWHAGRRIGFDSDLCDVAEDVGSCVSNSAGLECVLSNLRVTYSELPTNLGVEKAGKLAFLHRAFAVEK